MEKIERLEIMYEHARKIGACANRKTFAVLLGTTDGVVSRFFSGGRVLTDKFLLRVNEALDNAFSTEWVLYGTGEMYTASTETTLVSSTPEQEVVAPVSSDKRVADLEYLVDALKGTIESQKRTIKSQERIIEMLENENESLKKARTHVS